MRHGDRGFTYLGLLAIIVVIGLLLSAAGEVSSTAAQREREAQLLWAGHQYRDAIARYWTRKRVYPRGLQELLGSAAGDPIQLHDLRQLYPDPMTNAVDWTLVQAPNGGIMGVASASKRAPLKTAGFDDADQDFAKAATYGDWQFTFVPRIRRR